MESSASAGSGALVSGAVTGAVSGTVVGVTTGAMVKGSVGAAGASGAITGSIGKGTAGGVGTTVGQNISSAGSSSITDVIKATKKAAVVKEEVLKGKVSKAVKAQSRVLTSSTLAKRYEKGSFGTAKTYVKFARIQATQAQGGEAIETVLADGTKETANIANAGDWIVTNPGG